jgi:SAM-dependent methyltransferase
VSATYGAVDDSGAPADAVDWQRQMSDWPAVRAYKRRTHELFAGSAPILDVGCGPGVDAELLGTDRCVGFDASRTMATAAARRGVVVCRADAHRLPVADGCAAGVRTDRVLQHLAQPNAALAEFARVLAPGGRLVVAEPDQETLVIRVPGVRPRVLDRLKALRRDVGYRNGRIASALPDLLAGLGLDRIAVEAFPLVIRDPDAAFGLPTWPARWRVEGPFSDEELAEWDAALAAGPTSGFLYLVTVLVVTAVRTPDRGRQ